MANQKKDPTTRRRVRYVCFFVLGLLALNTSGFAGLQADRQWHRWEFAAALSGVFSLLDTTYHHDYSPQIYNYTVTELDSLVRQHVNIKGKSAMGAELKVNAFIGKKIGIQFLADFHNTWLKGTDNFEHIHLRFSFFPYPSLRPTIVYKDEWFSMGDTAGHLRQKTFSLNMLARFPLDRRISLDFSAGGSLFLYSGKAEPIGYIYHSFAHFIFVSIPYRFDFSIPATTALGVNIGEELNWSLDRHLFLYAAGRFYCSFGGSTEIKLISDLLRTTDQDQDWIQIIQQRLNLGPLKIKPSFFSLKIGLGLAF